MTEPEIIRRLEEAGQTILSLPASVVTDMRGVAIIKAALDVIGWVHPPMDAPTPSAENIARMEDAFRLFSIIPPTRLLLRRTVAFRCLIHPVTKRHLYTWRRLGTAFGAGRLAVRDWHATGISLIAGALSEIGKP